MVITNGANAGVAGLVGSSKVMLGQVRKYLLDDSVTLIITIKKSVHKNSPKNVHKNSLKKCLPKVSQKEEFMKSSMGIH